MANQELRYLSTSHELRAEPDSRKVSGYALVFDEPSVDLGGFVEIIRPGALDGVLERSDVLCLLDHNRDRGVLARCRYGEGSLKLTVDSRGLKYEFIAPNTALGDEVIESLKRHDISASSFGFTVREDRWTRTEDDTLLREIIAFEEIFDTSPVYHPAYPQTSVDLRSVEQSLSVNNSDIEEEMLTDDQKKLWMKYRSLIEAIEEEETRAKREDEEEKEEEKNSETEKQEEETEKSSEEEEKEENSRSEEEEKEEEKSSEDDKEKEECSEEDKKEECSEEDKEEKSKRNKKIINNHNNMNQKFSLLRGIRDLVEGRSFDEATQRVHDAGLAEFRKSNISVAKNSLVLPMTDMAQEKRGAILAGTAGAGQEVVSEEKLGLTTALRERLVLAQAGATFLPNCVGDISIPYYTGSVSGWKSEDGKADRGEGTFSEKFLKPKRLTSVIHISRQFLLQDSIAAEEAIKRDLIDSIAVQLEKTILGDGAGSAFEPKGLFAGVSADSAAITYSDMALLEAELEHSNCYGPFTYIVNPGAKAILRTTSLDGPGAGRFIMENNEILGLPTYSTQSVVDKGIIFGDIKEIYIASWSGVSITVDNLTLADQDTIRLIVNGYYDYCVRRDDAIVTKILA